jgi:hypothetical protein
MAKKNNKINRERKIGKQSIEKKPLIKPEHKNTFWTVVVLIILIIFFVVNNTRKEPEHGPYPPNYKPIQNERNINN